MSNGSIRSVLNIDIPNWEEELKENVLTKDQAFGGM